MNFNGNNTSKNNQEFLVNYALKTLATMMMQFSVTSVKHGSTSNVTILYCLSCTYKLFPFGNLNNQNFLAFIGENISEKENLKNPLILELPPYLALLFNLFNNTILENYSDPENVIQSKYYSINGL